MVLLLMYANEMLIKKMFPHFSETMILNMQKMSNSKMAKATETLLLKAPEIF